MGFSKEMDSEKQIMEKIIDTFLLPAVAFTFLALIYLGYRWSKQYERMESLTDLKEFTSPGNTEKSASVFINLPESCKIFNIERPVIIEIPNKPSSSNFLKTSDSEKLLSNALETKSVRKGLRKCPCIKTNMFYSSTSFPLQNCTTSDLQSECEPLWDYSDVFQYPTDSRKLEELEHDFYGKRNTVNYLNDNDKALHFTRSRVPELYDDDENSLKYSEQSSKAPFMKNEYKDYLQIAFD